MRVYMLKESDFQRLTTSIEAGVQRAQACSDQERRAVDDAYRHFNFIVRRWMDTVKNDDIKGEHT